MTDATGKKDRAARGVRVVRGYRMRHAVEPEAVFPLLCPLREYDWIRYWKCEMVYSESGAAETDCVFCTYFPDAGPQTWTCSRHEPDRRVEYVITGAHHVVRLAVELTPLPGGGCESRWTRVFTGLDEQGDALVADYDDEAHQRRSGLLERMLNHYLDTGQRLETV